MLSNRLSSALSRRATAWAGQLTRLAKKYAPAHLQKYIHSKREDKKDGTFSIIVYLDPKEDVAGPERNYKNGSADAFAQEFGSGPVDIVPKTKKFLAFQWDVADMNPGKFPTLPDGRVLFKQVTSPGVKRYKDRGYLGVAADELLTRGLNELDEDVRRAILGDLRISFKSAKK